MKSLFRKIVMTKSLIKKSTFLLSLILLVLTTSCRTEDDLSIDPPAEETIEADSLIAKLMSRVALNDGSSDNIIDNNSSLSVELPVTVTVNGIEVEVVDENGYQEIEDIIDFLNLGLDAIVISYPITVTLPDFTTVVVNSDLELLALSSGSGDNEDDIDIECIDFQYPISISYFDENTEIASTISITSDIELYFFIEDLENFAAVTINFPITVIYADNTTQTISTIQELETAIEAADNTCDEDDDNDYNDDDCDECTIGELEMLFEDCMEWSVSDLERNNNDLETIYEDYIFTFLSDGTITVIEGVNTFNGTWAASGNGNDIILVVAITGLNDFNGTWELDEIEHEPGDAEIEFSIGDDRLSFVSDCSSIVGGIDDEELVEALTTDVWYVTYYYNDIDETSNFADYEFNFAIDNTVTATDTSGTINGSWSTNAGANSALGIDLSFATSPLDALADNWDVIEVTNDIIRLKDVSGENGTDDFLTFERTPFDGGSIVENLGAILVSGLWYVDSYTEGTVDQTSNYNGFLINFSILGTVVATKVLVNNVGTWSVNITENQLNLNFGLSIPFNAFNNGAWDVISVSDTEVVIQDASGMNTLTLKKL